MEKIEGGSELLLTSPDEVALFDRQAAAQRSADTSKADAKYQNEPHDGEQCDGCSMFVPGFPDEAAGYCTKVQSFRGPLGMIFTDGWCKFFDPVGDEGEDLDVSDLDDYDDLLDEPPADAGGSEIMRALMLTAAAYVVMIVAAGAHDIWINQGGYRNAAGEWCCGEGDCSIVPASRIRIGADGYHVVGPLHDELVPFAEVQPSPDGAYWRCKKPDGTRRCFFAPPPTN